MTLLAITNLKKSYLSPEGESVEVVDVPHFELRDGEQIALQGGSGSGKTTFLNLIAGILQADGGEIVLAEQRITALSEAARDRARAAHLGYIFQTFNLLQGFSALENVMLGMQFANGIDAAFAKHLLERVGLADRMSYRPAQLSVGQQQRVAVARALANHPRLVLADEPTGNLDRRRGREALQLIREICREHNAALLLVSHDAEALGQFEIVIEFERLNRAGRQ